MKEEETGREGSGESGGGHLKHILVFILGASEAFEDRRSDNIKYAFLPWSGSFFDSFFGQRKEIEWPTLKYFTLLGFTCPSAVRHHALSVKFFVRSKQFLIHGLAWFSLW